MTGSVRSGAVMASSLVVIASVESHPIRSHGRSAQSGTTPSIKRHAALGQRPLDESNLQIQRWNRSQHLEGAMLSGIAVFIGCGAAWSGCESIGSGCLSLEPRIVYLAPLGV